MIRRSWKGLALCVLALAPLVASAQNLFELNPTNDEGGKSILGGSPAIDLLILTNGVPGAPLKHGGVIPGSERVELNGRILKAGADYTMDDGNGVVYMTRPFKTSDSLVVSYRYDANAPAGKPGQKFNGFAGFKFDMLQNGAMQGIFGLGMTERQADGSVLTSNVFGFNNKFSFGQGANLKGLYLIGDRQKARTEDAYGPKGDQAPTDEGKSKFLMQSLQGRLAGGTFSFDYQDISKNFAGFGAVQESGMDPTLVDQLQKEKGLKRFGFGLTGLNFGGVKLNQNFNSVADDKGQIDWRSIYAAKGDPDKGNGFRFAWNARSVDPKFSRFKDIREGDREQLMREAGLTRESVTGAFRSNLGKLSYDQQKIEDQSGNGIYKRSFQLFDGLTPESSRFSFGIGDQHVESGFGRVGSLTEPEKQAYGRELGLRRQWTNLQLGLWDPKNPLKYAQNIIRTDGGNLSTTKLSAGGANWSLQHVDASVDPGFTALDNLPEPEKLADIQTIGDMYAPGAPGLKPDAERGWFLRSQGIDREMTRIIWQPRKGLNLMLENLQLAGKTDDASVQSAALDGKGFSLSYRKQQMGDHFTELGNLLDYERQKLGSIIGLDRMDFAANLQIGHNQFAFAQTAIDSPDGGMNRQTVNITGKNLELSVNQRKVDPKFDNAGQLLDPEKDLLATLKGFNERDIKLKWQMISGLWLDVFWFDALSDAVDQTKQIHNASLNYAPDKNTNISFLSLTNKNDDPLKLLFANVLQRLVMFHNFGRLGAFAYTKEDQNYDGTTTDQPDSVKQNFAYEAKLDPKTMVKTEQTRTEYSNGTAESVSQNTVSTQLTKGAGVSVSEVRVDREGVENDETKRNYGFWVNLGHGMRFSYGYARHLAGENGGTMNSGTVLGQGDFDPLKGDQFNNLQNGQVGDWSMGGGYGVNEWDQNGRTQAFSKVQIGTVKPQHFLGLHDVNFNLGLDTQADYATWLRENRMVHFSGKLGNNGFLYEYRSQMHQSGCRAIDRLFAFQTDQDPKRWLVAKLAYKVRTLPWDDQVMIRDYSVTARPMRNFELSHKLQTNPEGPQRNDVILGSVPQPIRNSQWRLDYKTGPSWSLGGQYDETILEQNNSRSRKAGLNLALFQNSGSPLSIYYGLEQNDLAGVRKTEQRYSLRFDQRPGPHQMFSLFLSNDSFQHYITDGMKRNNWTMRVDYQLKF